MSPGSVEALRILLQFNRVQASGDPYGFRFEPQDYLVPTEGGASPSTRFEWTAEVLSELQAVRRPGRDPVVAQRIGERLRTFLQHAGWVEWERAIAQALSEKRPVLITIRSSAAELYALPWELLTLKTGQFIGEMDGLLIRYEWPESESAEEPLAPRAEGGRILMAWSAAGGSVPAHEHIQAIAAACESGYHKFDIETDVLAHASVDQITDKLAEAEATDAPIAILHLLCHGAQTGSTFGLALDGQNESAVVDGAQLRRQLAPFANRVRLLVLSACDTGNAGALGNQLGSVALSLHRCGFQAVVASRFPLSALGSVTFSECFYNTLLAGPESMEAAFLAARKRLAAAETGLTGEQRTLDWASIQLYARQRDGEDTRPVVFRPYRGLLAFQAEHRRFFFGRNAEIDEVVDDLQTLVQRRQPRFVVVAGASGTGKSSLVLAGAVPKLLATNPGLVFLKMRPGTDPDAALNKALSLRRTAGPALLVVDQFEEVFTHTTTSKAREAFVRRLWELASAPEPGLRILITLRVDFIGRCEELTVNQAGLRLDRVAYDEQYRVFLAKLGPDELRAAIVEPARKVGLELQAGLADRMVQEVGGEPGALPLLEDALDVLWQQREGRVLTQRVYDRLGGVIGTLHQRADQLIGHLRPADLPVAQRLLVHLVAVSEDTALDTRRRVQLAELRHAAAGTDAAAAVGFERVLKELVSARLLVQDGDGQTSTVEVAHEELIRKWPKLRTWLDEDRAGILVQRRVKQAALEWQRTRYDASLLYRGLQLARATPWTARLGELEHKFLDASLKAEEEQERWAQTTRAQIGEAEARLAQEKRNAEARIAEEKQQKELLQLKAAQTLNRRTRVAALGLGVALLAALAGLWQAHRKSNEAQARAAEAHDRLQIAVTQRLIADDPTSAAAILREVGQRSSPLWTRLAWDVLQEAVSASVLRGHESGIAQAVFSPDGKKIATGANDGTARIWNTEGGDTASILYGNQGATDSHRGPHDVAIGSVVFRPDGQRVLVGDYARTIRIWDFVGSGQPKPYGTAPNAVRTLAFDPSGRMLAVGGDSPTLYVLSFDAGKDLPYAARTIRGHEVEINSVAYSPDGKRLASGSADKTARIVKADGSGPPIVFRGHTDAVTGIAFSPDGKKLVTGSADMTARVWNADGSGLPIVLKSPATVLSVAVSPDGSRIVAGLSDNTVRIFGITGTGVPVVLKSHQAPVTSVAFSPDGQTILSSSWDKTARLWTAKPSVHSVVLLGHDARVFSVSFSQDGQKIVTGSEDTTVRVWNSDGSGSPLILSGHKAGVRSVAFSPDDQQVVSGSEDNTIRFWNAAGAGLLKVLPGCTERVSVVALSADVTKAAIGAQSEQVAVCHLDGAGRPDYLSGDSQGVLSVAFSPDGKEIITGSYDKKVRVFRSDFSEHPYGTAVTAHDLPISAVAYSPDGRKVVTGSWDKTVKIWDSSLTESPIILKGSESELHSVVFSPDGEKVVSGARDGTVYIFDTKHPSLPIVLKGHRDAVSTVAFSRDGKRIATASWDTTVRIWTLLEDDTLLAALWDATSDCLPVDRRQELLQESKSEAEHGHKRCRQEVSRRRRH